MLDCLLLIIPKLDPMGPTVGPSSLKACLQVNGFSAKVKDYNIDLYNSIYKTHNDLWFGEDETFYVRELYLELYNNTLKPFIKQWAVECINENAEWIGVSVFSQRSVYVAVDLINEIKRLNSGQKIVAGGAGLDFDDDESITMLSIADKLIFGDGEQAIVSLLKGEEIQTTPRTYLQMDNLDNNPFPDYSDINWNEYSKSGLEPMIYITGSRGCVRDCTFCDVAYYWPKYRFRSGKNITNEITYLNKETGFTHFEFSDSLVNGSMKAYRDMCVELTSLNDQLNDKITWAGQFICRSERQMPEEDWELTANSGAKELLIGIESGSERIRDHMRKKFTNNDMWFTFKMAVKYNIQVTVLTIVGYPVETDEDFQETLNMVETINELNNGTNLIRVSVGQSMKILPNTPIYDMASNMGITKGKLDWTYKDNNRKVRLGRLIDLLEITKKYGHRQVDYIEARLPALIKEYSNI